MAQEKKLSSTLRASGRSVITAVKDRKKGLDTLSIAVITTVARMDGFEECETYEQFSSLFGQVNREVIRPGIEGYADSTVDALISTGKALLAYELFSGSVKGRKLSLSTKGLDLQEVRDLGTACNEALRKAKVIGGAKRGRKTGKGAKKGSARSAAKKQSQKRASKLSVRDIDAYLESTTSVKILAGIAKRLNARIKALQTA